MISSTPCHDNHTDSDTVPVQIILMKIGEAIGHFSWHILQISDVIVTLCWLVGVGQWVECYRVCCWIYGQVGSYSAHFMCKICKFQQLKTIKKPNDNNKHAANFKKYIKKTLWHCENVTTNKQQIVKFDFCRSLLMDMSGHYSINMELELGY